MNPRFLVAITAVLLLPVAGEARKRDPLHAAEVEQLRETKEDPNKRLKLLVTFARARMLAIEQTMADPKLAENRARDLHGLIEDFNSVVEELEDNIDMFDRQRVDLRKSLKEVIEAYSEWQLKLRTIRETSKPEDLKQYSFVLETATETINAGAELSRDTLQDHIKRAEDAKKKK
jgi:hypothetical protein